jgi:hypothetical protein
VHARSATAPTGGSHSRQRCCAPSHSTSAPTSFELAPNLVRFGEEITVIEVPHIDNQLSLDC